MTNQSKPISPTEYDDQIPPLKKRRLRIGIVAVRAANSMQSWRGVMRSMTSGLREAGAEAVSIEIGDGILGHLFRLKEYVVRRIIGRRYQRHREPLMLRAYGRAMDRALAMHGCDVAISLKAMPMSQSKTKIPVILYNDSPFSGLLNFYAEFTGMSAGHVAHGHAMENGTARKAAVSIYTSEWAAALTVRDYHIDPQRVQVVPIGANLEVRHTRAEIEALIKVRAKAATRRFFWLGVDWERKRGAMAVEIVLELQRRGYPAELTIAGAAPKIVPKPEPGIHYIDFLDRPGIIKQLEATDFLLLPTLADCTPVVYSEANALGVPVVSTNVGGIGTSIIEGRNGLLFDVDATVGEWADRISHYLDRHGQYTDLALLSYNEYETRLNWKVATRRIFDIASSLVRD